VIVSAGVRRWQVPDHHGEPKTYGFYHLTLADMIDGEMFHKGKEG
jgi:hypothetical protein